MTAGACVAVAVVCAAIMWAAIVIENGLLEVAKAIREERNDGQET